MRREMFDSSLGAMLQEVVGRHGEQPAMRFFRQAVWQRYSWGDVGQRVKNLGLGLIDLGVEPGDRVALLGPNSPEWALTDWALISIGAVTVPLYPTLDSETMASILRDSGCRGILAVGDAAAERADELAVAQKRTEKNWLTIAAETSAPQANRLSFSSILEKGEKQTDKSPFYARLEGLHPSSMCTIIYTSGTTGVPKGVMLSHRNLASNVMASFQKLSLRAVKEVYLSLLPLSHGFERIAHLVFMSLGAEIVYARGFDRLAEDLLEIEPTIVVAVPRVYEKFYARVMENVAQRTAVSRALFRWAVNQGKEVLRGGTSLGYPLAKGLFLNKIRARLGRRIRFAVSGGGALDPEITRFFNAAGVPLIEGYGMTEASPIISCNPLQAIQCGSVGTVYNNLEAKLDDKGELLVRGPSVALGYYNRPKETSETFDEEGWLHTGDQASFDDHGYLKITGRFRDIIKTAGGKMVAPQRLVEKVRSLGWCDQVGIVGEGRSYLVALVVPEVNGLRRLLGEKSERPLEELVLDERIWELVEGQIQQMNTTLAPFETIKHFALLPHAFSETDGTLTPTLKVRRHVVEKKYARLIDKLYGDRSLVFDADGLGQIPVLPRDFRNPSLNQSTSE